MTTNPGAGRTARVLRLLLALALLLPLLGGFFTEPAGAQASPADSGVAVVLQVSGLLDPLLADFVADGIQNADAEGARVVVLQLNSTGAVISDEEINDLARVINDATVPVTMWVGPSGARAEGPWAQMAGLVDRIGIAPGSRLGNAGERVLDDDLGDLLGAAGSQLRNDTIGAAEAIELGIVPADAPTVGDFVIGLSDLGVATSVSGEGEDARTVSDTVVRFERLSLLDGQLHTVAVGAGMFLLGCFGLWILPVSLFALGLLVFSMFAFSIDVQTGVPRFWTIVGAIALLVGTVLLYRGGVSMSWIPMSVGVIGITMMMVTGMPTMVRTRFSTPTIGREWMVGQTGEAVEAVDPDGVVKIDDALWKARTNRATPVAAGDRIRVASVEGLVLEVEPEEGAARDYRERRPKGDEARNPQKSNTEA